MGRKKADGRKRAVVAYNDLAGKSFFYSSVRECARELKVPYGQVLSHLKDGRWIFGEMTVKVRYA